PRSDKPGRRRGRLPLPLPARLEATHLARRSRTTMSRFAADDPTHRRIMAQTQQGGQTLPAATNRPAHGGRSCAYRQASRSLPRSTRRPGTTTARHYKEGVTIFHFFQGTTVAEL